MLWLHCFVRYENHPHALMASTVTTVGDLQDMPDNDMACRKQLHSALGLPVAAMRPDKFLATLPLETDGPNLESGFFLF